ncbi:hypothetical protein KDK_24100 [Dictyobacter kobayashii]|uniref:Uncharacterized protein n=1 Tax=Dictyobacter kobayashii TaxID=2014872 RepID=A0A402AHL6_9CHLR|nr:hypothetical protein KDK_24100 [Dictyobacter kobayashii]
MFYIVYISFSNIQLKTSRRPQKLQLGPQNLLKNKGTHRILEIARMQGDLIIIKIALLRF